MYGTATAPSTTSIYSSISPPPSAFPSLFLIVLLFSLLLFFISRYLLFPSAYIYTHLFSISSTIALDSSNVMSGYDPGEEGNI